MSMFSKPQVGVTFTGEAETADVVVPVQQTLWAHNAARRVAIGVMLAILCVAAYVMPIVNGSSLPGDQTAMIRQPIFYAWSGFGTIWLHPRQLPEVSPVAYSLMLVEHQFFAEKFQRGYRTIGLLLHIITTLLLLRLLNRLELTGAWLGAALFALHPIQVDAVSWISQQRYLICGIFYISAALIYLRRVGLNPMPEPQLPGAEPLVRIALPESPVWLYVLSMLFFVLALLSHPLGATFPLAMLVLIWWERGAIVWDDIRPLVLPAVLIVGLLVLLVVADKWGGGSVWATFAGWKWIIYVSQGAWSFARLIVLPIGLSFAHTRWDREQFAVWQLAYPIALIITIAALWRMRGKWGRGPLASVLMFLVLLLPAAFGVNDAGDAFLPGITLKEHQAYLACAALLVSAATLLVDLLLRSPQWEKLLRSPGVAPTAAFAAAALLATCTAVHARAYNDPVSLWEQAIKGQGDSVVALNALGTLKLDQKNYADAEARFHEAYDAALQQNVNTTESLVNLAHVAEGRGDWAGAIARYDQILHDQPNNRDVHFSLAQAYVSEGQVADGLKEYDIVLAMRPNDANVYNNLGLVYARQGESDRSLEAYKKAIQIDPTMTAAYLNMANTQFQLGHFVEAKDALQSAIKIDPHNYITWLNAGVMATTVGDLESGERYFHFARYYNMKSADACNDLGMVLMRMSKQGKKSRASEAITYFRQALDIDPDNVAAKTNLAEAQRQANLDRAHEVSQP